MKCCANIYFNQKCLKQNLTPNYANIKIPITLPGGTFTQTESYKLQIRD